MKYISDSRNFSLSLNSYSSFKNPLRGTRVTTSRRYTIAVRGTGRLVPYNQPQTCFFLIFFSNLLAPKRKKRQGGLKPPRSSKRSLALSSRMKARAPRKLSLLKKLLTAFPLSTFVHPYKSQHFPFPKCYSTLTPKHNT